MTKRFLLGYGILCSFLAASTAAWNTLMPEKFQSSALWVALLVVALTSLAVVYILNRNQPSPAQFVRKFMAVTFLKLFFYLIIIVVYAFLNRAQAIHFIMAFLAFYVLFTAFEVISLTGQLKNNKP